MLDKMQLYLKRSNFLPEFPQMEGFQPHFLVSLKANFPTG